MTRECSPGDAEEKADTDRHSEPLQQRAERDDEIPNRKQGGRRAAEQEDDSERMRRVGTGGINLRLQKASTDVIVEHFRNDLDGFIHQIADQSRQIDSLEMEPPIYVAVKESKGVEGCYYQNLFSTVT